MTRATSKKSKKSKPANRGASGASPAPRAEEAKAESDERASAPSEPASEPPPAEPAEPAERAAPASLEEAALAGVTPKRSPEARAEEAFGELKVTLDADDENEARRAALEKKELVAASVPITKKVVVAMGVLGALIALPYIPAVRDVLVTKRERGDIYLGNARVLTEGVILVPNNETEAEKVARVAEAARKANEIGEKKTEEITNPEDSPLQIDAPIEQPKGPIAQDEKKLVIPPPSPTGLPPQNAHILDPSGKALDHFFDKLMAAERKDPGAIVRVLYYGDSIVASDLITGKLRRLLQDRFGDAGHGYAIAANAYAGWIHFDVARKASDQWKASRCLGPLIEDMNFGLGCATFTARKADEWFTMGTSTSKNPKDVWGRAVSRFELEYYKQPGGGDLDISVDGNKVKSISTDGDAGVAYESVPVDDGEHKIEVRTTTEKPTRVFGMRMERDVPGVSLTSLGMTGARLYQLDKQDNDHWAKVLQAAKPDLVVLAYGTNEIADGNMGLDDKGQKVDDPMGLYASRMKSIMTQVRAAVPDASVMIVGPPDMGSTSEGEGHSKSAVPLVVNTQKKVAAEEGWAFWDQLKVMGGQGMMYAWSQSGYGQADLIHPSGSGGGMLGTWEFQALMELYEKYKDSKR
ncbi:MAG: GDSL-type esterase/lipase family protein [Polyangiaceae bacterium]